MIKNLAKTGNSLAILIPRPLAEALEWNEETVLKITIQDNGLFVRRAEQVEKQAPAVPEKPSLFKKIQPKGK